MGDADLKKKDNFFFVLLIISEMAGRRLSTYRRREGERKENIIFCKAEEEDGNCAYLSAAAKGSPCFNPTPPLDEEDCEAVSLS